MSSINKILNAALSEGLLDESADMGVVTPALKKKMVDDTKMAKIVAKNEAEKAKVDMSDPIGTNSLGDKVQTVALQAKNKATEYGKTIGDKATEYGKSAWKNVKESPWKSAGIGAASIGAGLGALALVKRMRAKAAAAKKKAKKKA